MVELQRATVTFISEINREVDYPAFYLHFPLIISVGHLVVRLVRNDTPAKFRPPPPPPLLPFRRTASPGSV